MRLIKLDCRGQMRVTTQLLGPATSASPMWSWSEMIPIVQAKPTWQRGGIAVVCEKCTKERYVEDFPESAGDERLDIKGYLKNRLKAEGRWGPIRVVTSSCLDICARGTVTVLLDPLARNGTSGRCIVVDALHGREQLYDAIIDELTPPERTDSRPAEPH